jgi:hypothetical protein
MALAYTARKIYAMNELIAVAERGPWWEWILPVPVILALVTALQKIAQTWLAVRAERNISNANEIYEALHNAARETKCGRVLVLAAHNCGGPILSNNQIFSSIIYEVAVSLEPKIHRYEQFQLDDGYLEVMAKMLKDGYVWLNPEKDIRKTSLLYTVYMAENIKRAFIFAVQTSNKRIVYGSVVWTEDKDLEHKLLEKM